MKQLPGVGQAFLAQVEVVILWIAVATLGLLGMHSVVLVLLWSFFECQRFWKSRGTDFS
jgi:hypothetical protein